MKIVVAMVAEKVKMLQKHVDPDITQKLFKLKGVKKVRSAIKLCSYYF